MRADLALSEVSCCGRVNRRVFLADCGMGFTGLVLGAMLQQDGVVLANSPEAWRPPDGKPHFAPKAKSVIWIFMQGGVSHVETFDPKPALNKYGGRPSEKHLTKACSILRSSRRMLSSLRWMSES